MRYIFCAECGEKLEVFRKAVPSLQKVFEIVGPHNCGEATLGEPSEQILEKMVENENKPPSKLDKLFNSFKYVQKLNNLEPIETNPMNQETGDKRDKEHLRKELQTSTAPLNLLNNIKNLPHSQPTGNTEEPKGD